MADHQSTEPGTVDVIDLFQIQNGSDLAGIDQLGEMAAQVGGFRAHDYAPLQVHDRDSFYFPLLHFKCHDFAFQKVTGLCGIASPSQRGSEPAKFTLRLVSRTTASPCPTL